MKSILKSINITSIDFNPSKYYRILNSPDNANRFLKGIVRIDSPSVTYYESIQGFHDLYDQLISYDFDILARSLSDFITIKEKKCELISLLNSKKDFINCLISHPSHNIEYGFYEKQNILNGKGFCSKMLKEKKKFDAIFFDCGELSSAAEWMILNKQIRKGGYVLLHDIYYPKSIKNFLVATHISLSTDWEIIYIDKISTQGGLIAKKRI